MCPTLEISASLVCGRVLFAQSGAFPHLRKLGSKMLPAPRFSSTYSECCGVPTAIRIRPGSVMASTMMPRRPDLVRGWNHFVPALRMHNNSDARVRPADALNTLELKTLLEQYTLPARKCGSIRYGHKGAHAAFRLPRGLNGSGMVAAK